MAETSPQVLKVNEILEKSQFVFTPEAFAQHKKIIQRFERAKALKQARYKYYDGMTYEEDYATNENLKNTFLTPKSNESEVRVNTGTSEKKLDAIKNELLTMNLQHEIRSTDEDDLEIQELGDDMGDIVTRTNQIEKDEDFQEEFIDEILSQRLVYVRESFQTTYIKRGKVKLSLAKKELISGLKVFPGSWTIPAYLWDTQPYVITSDRVSYEQAEAIFQNFENWQHVMPNKGQRDLYLGGAYSYQFGELQDGEVEINVYRSLPDNEYQVYLNGVPMYGPAEPLPYEMDHYDIRAYNIKTMSRNFLAGRPFTAMAKTMQAVANETIRLLIRKFQQALEPPMATGKGGKIYSKGIWNPGAVTQGLRKNDFERLIDHNGVTDGEFAMYKLIEEKTEEFIGTPNIAQGLQGSREMSATEVLTMQKQFIKQLGYVVAALIRAKRDLTEMRVYTVLENYLTPTKRKFDDLTKEVFDVYRSLSIDNAKFENNRKGKKIIKFMDRDLTQEEQQGIKQFEDDQEQNGNPIRIKTINVKTLQKFPILWYVTVTMQEKEGTALDKVTFQDQLTQAAMITKVTGKPMNPDVVTETFERKWKAKDWFNVQAPEGEQQSGIPGEPNQVQKDSQKLMDEMSKFENTTGAQVSRGLRTAGKSASDSMGALETATQ